MSWPQSEALVNRTMMFWTHIFDLLGKAVAMAILVVVMVLPFWLWNDRQLGLPWIIGGVVAGGTAWWWVLRPLSSWLYARVHLGTGLSWEQARQASALFSPVRNMASWHPMKQCRSLPAAERTAAIMAKVEAIRDYYRARAAELGATSVSARLVRGLLWLVISACGVATLANVPPCSWLNELQTRMFDGGYYPMLTLLVAALPALIALRILDKKYGVRSVDPARYVPARSSETMSPIEAAPESPVMPKAETVERDWRPPAEMLRRDKQPPV